MKVYDIISGNRNNLSDSLQKEWDNIPQDKIFLDKGEEWGVESSILTKSGSYLLMFDLYWGPVSGTKHLDDYFGFDEGYMKSILDLVGCETYELYAAENLHILYFDNKYEANKAFDEISKIIKSQGFKVIS